ncbi:MAG: hypothetical protein ACPG19_07075 [Saprospiraceae bacterium]
MKKINLFLLLVIGLTFSGCLEYGIEAENQLVEKILGEWKIARGISPTDGEFSGGSAILNFQENNIYIIESNGQTYTLEYSIEPGYLYLNGNRRRILSFKKDELVVFDENSENIIYYERVN